MSNEAPACHVERLETSHELSPCASLSRDDNNRTLTLELAKKDTATKRCLLLGALTDSNRGHSEPQSDALTN